MRHFYKTTFTIEVLSEEPIQDLDDLVALNYEITDGGCVGGPIQIKQEEISRSQMVQYLTKFDSDPDFFGLEEDGSDNGLG